MRVLHFSTDDVDGGAGKAAFRLHRALRAAGHGSRMLVRRKRSTDPEVVPVPSNVWRSGLRRLRRYVPGLRLDRPKTMFNQDIDQGLNTSSFLNIPPTDIDMVCLHWVSHYLTTQQIARIHQHFNKPLLWVLMDLEPLAGGCHYPGNCERAKQGCGNCPQLPRPAADDQSRAVWLRKQQHLAPLPLVFVAPTRWVARRIRQSQLFRGHRIETIPLAIDTELFRPANQRAARQALGLPPDKKIVLFGASSLAEPRKGLPHLVEALRRMVTVAGSPASKVRLGDLFLLAVGGDSRQVLNAVSLPGHDLGYLRDERQLALAYQAADVFVCPSIEDAGPMMIAESMLCGTPVVAFDTGGAPDLIRTRQNGYLARYRDSLDLAHGIAVVLEQAGSAEMRTAATVAALAAHAPRIVVAQFAELCASFQFPRSQAA